MREYNSTKRIHDPAYYCHHVSEMKKLAIRGTNSNAIIYCMVDLRTALELTEYTILLASVGEELRQEISELTKAKNGIDAANKKLKTLKEKYQMFYQAVCEVIGLKGKFYDTKKSDDLQYRVSAYLHPYYRTQIEIDFGSDFMNDGLALIDETIAFIKDSLMFDGSSYSIQNIEKAKIPPEDQLIFEEWKNSVKMTYEELKGLLRETAKNRRANDKNL